MDKKKVFILGSVLLCVMGFLVELFFVEREMEEQKNIAKVKSTFQDDIQALKDGKYDNLTASDFQVSIEGIENVYRLQILSIEDDVGVLENFDFVIEDDRSAKNVLEYLWKMNEKNDSTKEMIEDMNLTIDKFFQTKVDKTDLLAHYCIDEAYRKMEYNEFENSLEEVMSDFDYFSLFGNDIAEGGYMIQIGSTLNDAWFSRGELGDIMPSLNDCRSVYHYLSGKRQGEDVLVNLLDGKIWLSELEKNVMEYLNTDAFPLVQIKGIHYEIGAALVIENEKYEEYDGVCFVVHRVYKGIPFAYRRWGRGYECDMSEISYARSNVPDTMRAFYGIDGEVVELQELLDILSLGEALEILSRCLGDKNGVYEIRGVELVYKSCSVPADNSAKLVDILEPKWRFVVCTKGSKKEMEYFVDVVTGEIG